MTRSTQPFEVMMGLLGAAVVDDAAHLAGGALDGLGGGGGEWTGGGNRAFVPNDLILILPGYQNVRMAISAGAASRPVISSSRRVRVIEQPAMSRDVQ
jgi:hypothetical protein